MRSHTRPNYLSLGASLLACVLISLCSATQSAASASEYFELIDTTNAVVQSNTVPVLAGYKKVSQLPQKRFKRLSQDHALLTSPREDRSPANPTWVVPSAYNQPAYGFDFVGTVSERGPPTLA
jgi:hypothetical protein